MGRRSVRNLTVNLGKLSLIKHGEGTMKRIWEQGTLSAKYLLVDYQVTLTIC